jgi:hypothetical protein
MKYLKGILFGSIFGFAAGVAISEERRVDLIRRARTLPRQAAGLTPEVPRTPEVVPEPSAVAV